MGNIFCCASRKNKADEDFDEDFGAELREGIRREAKQERQKVEPGEFKINAAMQAYIDEHLEAAASHLDSNKVLDFDYFKSFFKTAHIWNRIYFRDQE